MQQTFIDLNKLKLKFDANQIVSIEYDSKISLKTSELCEDRKFKHKKIRLKKNEYIHLASLAESNQRWIYLLRSVVRNQNRYLYVLSAWYVQLVGKVHFVQQKAPEFVDCHDRTLKFKIALEELHLRTRHPEAVDKTAQIQH